MMKLLNKTKLKIRLTDKTKRNKRFESLCIKSQSELKKQMAFELRQYGKVREGDGWIYKEGEIPILLVAHMDTVHIELPQEIIYGKGIITSPQGIGGDDRCGVYMIMEILKKKNCHVLFVEDEEVGCVGSGKFTQTELCKSLVGKFQYMIELDRRGENDAVFYYCENAEFTDFITEQYWEEQQGSYSDIVELSPALECASVNLSCGYFNEHHKEEYVNLNNMERNIKEVIKLIDRTESDKIFEYVENQWRYYDTHYGYGYGYGNEIEWCVEYLIEEDNYDTESVEIVVANSYEEAVGVFCMNYPNIPYSQILSIYDASFE